VSCIYEMLEKKLGDEGVNRIFAAADIPKSARASMSADIDDAKILRLLGTISSETKLSQAQVLDTFSEYWVGVYAPRIYGVYYRNATNAKDFLLNMGKVHEQITASMPNAHPPKFNYSWLDDNTMVMEYHSNRGLVDLMHSLIKAVGNYYKTPLKTEKAGLNKVKVTFP